MMKTIDRKRIIKAVGTISLQLLAKSERIAITALRCEADPKFAHTAPALKAQALASFERSMQWHQLGGAMDSRYGTIKYEEECMSRFAALLAETGADEKICFSWDDLAEDV